MKSIIIILPYFGKLPAFFPFWLKSCEENTSIDFLIVTDCDVSSPASNIHIVKSNLSEIKKRAENFLGFVPSLEKPYKLCDYKPLYGELFCDYISCYDFWGYCDCDMILGDIRQFISDDILSKYDYILGMGHLHLQKKNDPKFEAVWKSTVSKQGYDWRQIYNTSMNCCFDELPSGVSATYYMLYPDKVFTGFSLDGRCFDSCGYSYFGFLDTFNNRGGGTSKVCMPNIQISSLFGREIMHAA